MEKRYTRKEDIHGKKIHMKQKYENIYKEGTYMEMEYI